MSEFSQTVSGGDRNIESSMRGRIRGMEKKIQRINDRIGAYDRGVSYARLAHEERMAHRVITPDTYTQDMEKQTVTLRTSKVKGHEKQIEHMQGLVEAYNYGKSEEEKDRNERSRYASHTSTYPYKKRMVEEKQQSMEEFKRELIVVMAAKKTLFGLGAIPVKLGIVEFTTEGYYDEVFHQNVYGRMKLNRYVLGTYAIIMGASLVSTAAVAAVTYGVTHPSEAQGVSTPNLTPPPVVREADRSIEDIYSELRVEKPIIQPTPTAAPTPTPTPTPVETTKPEPTPTPQALEKAEPEVPEFRNSIPSRFMRGEGIASSPLLQLPAEAAKVYSNTIDEMEHDGKQNGYYFVNIGRGGVDRAVILLAGVDRPDKQGNSSLYVISQKFGPKEIIVPRKEAAYIRSIIEKSIKEANSAGRQPKTEDLLQLADFGSVDPHTIGLSPGEATGQFVHLEVNGHGVYRNIKKAPDIQVMVAVTKSKEMGHQIFLNAQSPKKSPVRNYAPE